MRRRKRIWDFWQEWADMMAEGDAGGEKGRHSSHGGPGRHGGPSHPFPPDPEELREFFRSFMGTPPGEHWLFGARRFKPWRMGDWLFNPFVSALLSKSGGLLPLYTLHLLSDAPHYGNEIITTLAERTSEQGLANPAAVYPLLAEMEARGFVESDWDDPVKRTTRQYTITRAGREELARLKAIMRPKLREAIEVLKDLLDELEDDNEELENDE
ncbi:MAG: PadR family transcriptional regulator [Anaerolineae bacterium]|nr:PadR family transcriptional regulator [Anaerolineae bacterium]